MDTKQYKLHVVFFPFMAPSHIIQMLDIAKTFAAHNVKTTIVTTPFNAPIFLKPLRSYKNTGPAIDIEIIPFPSKEGGLPEGVENIEQLGISDEMSIKFLQATTFLQEPLVKVLENLEPKPNCLVADTCLPNFTVDVAAKFNIPRLHFTGSCCFALCVMDAFVKYMSHLSVSSDDEEFLIPHLPHEIKITNMQLMKAVRQSSKKSTEYADYYRKIRESEIQSYGAIVNSFYGVEPEYADYYRKVLGRKAWQIGPVSLCNRDNDIKFQRGKDSSIDEHECLKWLDSKKPNSVIYICFGSMSEVSPTQLHEIARGLEASEHDFIWALRTSKNVDDKEEWLPEGFEERVKGKVLIIRGWAPQVLILDHVAVGGFLTHCGWNSTLESISCGVPMITWPVFAEQFYNEKLVTDILKIGIPVGGGAKEWDRTVKCTVKWEDIKVATRRLMIGDEASEITRRVDKLKEMARKAVEEGGSSDCELSSLIEELCNYTNVRPLALDNSKTSL